MVNIVDFVEVTSADDGHKIAVNLSQVLTFSSNADGTCRIEMKVSDKLSRKNDIVTYDINCVESYDLLVKLIFNR